MPSLSSIFSTLIREAPVPSDAPARPFPAHDEFEGRCDHCRRITVWKLACVVVGIRWYVCTVCGDTRR